MTRLRLRFHGEQQMKRKELSVEMGLDADPIAVGEVVTEEVNLDALDRTLNAGALSVTHAIAGNVLGMVPVDLR